MTTSRKQRLELTWIGKEMRPRLEPRVLLEDPERSYHTRHWMGKADHFDNRLIVGDNLLALKALEQEFTGIVKCIYIDPPFNTGQAFDHYDDGVEHSLWLSLIRDRVELLHRLLSVDGTLFVHIDDNELAYLVVVLDEVFGRANRVAVVTFKQGAPTGHKAINPGVVTTTNFVLIYAKSRAQWVPNRVFVAQERDKRYSQFVRNRNGPIDQWQIVPLLTAFADDNGLSPKSARARIKNQPEFLDAFVLEHAGEVARLARPDYSAVSAAAREVIDRSRAEPKRVFHLPREEHSDFYFIRGERILFYDSKLKTIDGMQVAGEPLTTLWDDLLSNNLHNEGGVAFPKGKKPEALLKRVIELSTRRGDWVLDSFAGSGTTGAVAHKMGRRWIMVELGAHAHSLVIPRIRRVIDGDDPSGVTKEVGWAGGGGFRYYRLAPSLIETDKWGNPVINKTYNAEMLAEALCKLEGFTYAPSETVYWQQGRSTERDFLYVTTAHLGPDQLQQLSDEVGADRTLLVLCTAFRANVDRFPNLTVRKIPSHVLSRCEWGRDDYSLAVANLPPAPPQPGQQDLFAEAPA